MAKKCAKLAALTADDVFPGSCANDDLGAVSDCVVSATLCEVCRKVEEADNLDLDCDLIDAGNNDSCPVIFQLPDPNDIVDPNAPAP